MSTSLPAAIGAFLGPYSSGHTLDESSVAEKYRVPMVQGGGAAKQIFDRGYHYIFGTAPPAELYFGSTVEMMTKLDPHVQTLALLTADDAFDVSVRAGTIALAKQDGIDVVVDQVYPERNPNFTSLLAVVKSKRRTPSFSAAMRRRRSTSYARRSRSTSMPRI